MPIIILFYIRNRGTAILNYLPKVTERTLMKAKDLEECPGESRCVLLAGMGCTAILFWEG